MDTPTFTSKTILSSDLVNHILFEELLICSDAYITLSGCVFAHLTPSKHILGNLDSFFFDLLGTTIESIRTLLMSGAFGDAYALMRRFDDISWRHVNVMIRLEEPTLFDDLVAGVGEEMNSEQFVKFVEEIWANGYGVDVIENWLTGVAQLPKHGKFDDYKTDILVKSVFSLLNKAELKDAKDRGNDYVHLNHYKNLHLNNPRNPRVQSKLLDQVSLDFRAMYIRHASMTFAIHQAYMASTDYIDSLECGLAPTEGSQYWVAPYIQNLFDRIITKYNPPIAECIKEHSYMELNVP